MFLFKSAASEPETVPTAIAEHHQSTVGKKSRKKKRHNKKKSKATKQEEDTPEHDSDNSGDESDEDLGKVSEVSQREESVGTGGSHVDVTINLISDKLKVDKEEVKRCVMWMFDRGLKYDVEEEVEKELKKQTYATAETEEETEGTAQSGDEIVEAKHNGEKSRHQRKEAAAAEEIVNAEKDIKERLKYVASYAMVDLPECLVALCSWAAIQRTKSQNTSQLFFESQVLTILYFAILSNEAQWKSSVPNVKEVLSNMFTELTGSRDFGQWVIEALNHAFIRIAPHHKHSSALLEENKAFIETVANQIAHATSKFWSEYSNAASPQVVTATAIELTKFAKSSSILSWLNTSATLKADQEEQLSSSTNNLNDRQVELKVRVQKLVEMTSKQLESLDSAASTIKKSVATVAAVSSPPSSVPAVKSNEHPKTSSQPQHTHVKEDYDLEFKLASEKKKEVQTHIEKLLHDREDLLEEIRKLDFAVAECTKELGAVNRQLFMIDRNRKTAMAAATATKQEKPKPAPTWNDAHHAGPAAPATPSVDTTIAEGFVDDLFKASQRKKQLDDSVDNVVNQFKALIVEESSNITACVHAIRSKRSKKGEFRRQRAAYENLNLHKLVLQVDREDRLVDEQVTLLSAYVDASLDSLTSLLHSVPQTLVDRSRNCPSVEIIGVMLFEIETLDYIIPHVFSDHAWTKDAWNERKMRGAAAAKVKATAPASPGPAPVAAGKRKGQDVPKASSQKAADAAVAPAAKSTADTTVPTKSPEAPVAEKPSVAATVSPNANASATTSATSTPIKFAWSVKSDSNESPKPTLADSFGPPRSISATRPRAGPNNNTPNSASGGNRRGGRYDKRDNNSNSKKEKAQDTLSLIADIEKRSAIKPHK